MRNRDPAARRSLGRRLRAITVMGVDFLDQQRGIATA
jgi:hypothetical protein